MSIKKSFSVGLMMAVAVSFGHAQNASDSPDKVIDKIVGTWKIQRILSGNTEVAKNPTSGQWIEFRSDGKYVHQVTQPDSGSYRIDENRLVLFLESSLRKGNAENSPKQIDEWSLSFKDGTMTMRRPRPNKKQHRDNMTYVYVRIADGESVKADPK